MHKTVQIKMLEQLNERLEVASHSSIIQDIALCIIIEVGWVGKGVHRQLFHPGNLNSSKEHIVSWARAVHSFSFPGIRVRNNA